jgi:hypothetical protein
MISLQRVRQRLLNGSLGWHRELGVLVLNQPGLRYWIVSGSQARSFHPPGTDPVITEQVIEDDGRWRVTCAVQLYTGVPVIPPVVDGRAWVLNLNDEPVVFVDGLTPLYSTREHAEAAAADFGPDKVVGVVEVGVVKLITAQLQRALTFHPPRIVDTQDLNGHSIT